MAIRRQISKKLIKKIEEERIKTTPNWRRTFLAIPNSRHPPRMYLVARTMEHKAFLIKMYATKDKCQ